MTQELPATAAEQCAPTPPTKLEYLGFGLSFLLWMGGGVAVAYGLSQWESYTHQDELDLAQVRLIGNLVMGGLFGLVLRGARFAQHGR